MHYTENEAKWMKTISISLDGMEETHNRLRKIENGFQKTVQAIKDLKQAAFLNQIEVTTVVNIIILNN